MPGRKSIQETLDTVLATVQDQFASELVCFAHYGPTLELDLNQPNPNHEPIRLLLVLTEMNSEPVLQRLADLGPDEMVTRQTSWLTLSEQELVRSTDVFPVLFTEMQRRYQLIAGTDILADLDIREQHLRLRCEQQFKLLLFELQSDLHSKPKDVHARLADQLLRFEEICSGALLLLGRVPPRDNRAMLEMAAESMNLNLESIQWLQDQIGTSKLLRKKCANIQIQFISLVRAASTFVDQMEDEIIEVDFE